MSFTGRLLVMLGVLGALLLYCQKDRTPIGPNTGTPSPPTGLVDPLVIGDWLYLEENHLSGGIPYGYAFRFTPEGYRIHLGIEWNTGKLQVDPVWSPDSVIMHDGKFIFFFNPLNGGAGTDSGRYEVTRSILKLYHSALLHPQIFSRSEVGTIVAGAVLNSCTAIIDGDTVENSRVYVVPSAVAWYNSEDTSLQVVSHWGIPGNWESLIMYIKDFQGTGSYSLGGSTRNYGKYEILSGDFPIVFSTDSLRTGFLRVDSFDLLNGRCRGTFAYRVGVWGGDREVEITQGQFDVPIF